MMEIKAELLTVDFKENTVTFQVDEKFFDKVNVKAETEKSTIKCDGFVFKK